MPAELAEDSDTEDVEADNVEGNGEDPAQNGTEGLEGAVGGSEDVEGNREDPAQNGTEGLEGAVGGSEDSIVNNLEAVSLEEEVK